MTATAKPWEAVSYSFTRLFDGRFSPWVDWADVVEGNVPEGPVYVRLGSDSLVIVKPKER